MESVGSGEGFEGVVAVALRTVQEQKDLSESRTRVEPSCRATIVRRKTNDISLRSVFPVNLSFNNIPSNTIGQKEF